MKFTNILIAKSPAANETIAGIIISELKAKEDCTKVSSQAPNIVGSPRTVSYTHLTLPTILLV